MIGPEPDGATPLDRDELAGCKFKNLSTRGQLDELEQANITQGMRWLALRRGRDVLSSEFIRTLHRKLFGEVWSWAGEYRRRDKNIGVEAFQIGVQLQRLLENAQYWLEHEVYAPMEAGVRFHHRLVQIHPFANGNGRHARIAADTFLKVHYEHAPIQWASGRDLEADNARRVAYIAALRRADAGNFTALLQFVGA